MSGRREFEAAVTGRLLRERRRRGGDVLKPDVWDENYGGDGDEQEERRSPGIGADGVKVWPEGWRPQGFKALGEALKEGWRSPEMIEEERTGKIGPPRQRFDNAPERFGVEGGGSVRQEDEVFRSRRQPGGLIQSEIKSTPVKADKYGNKAVPYDKSDTSCKPWFIPDPEHSSLEGVKEDQMAMKIDKNDQRYKQDVAWAKSMANPIKSASKAFGVDPAFVSAIMLDERRRRSDYEGLSDSMRSDASLGQAQMKVSTAMALYNTPEVKKKMDALFPGIKGEEDVRKILLDEDKAVYFVAAMLRNIQDKWKPTNPDKCEQNEAAAIIYHKGQKSAPHKDPVPDDRAYQILNQYRELFKF